MKKTLLSMLLGILLLCLPALAGFLQYQYMPHGYLLTLIFAGSLGCIFAQLLLPALQPDKKYGVELLVLTLTLLPAYGLFVLIFNLCNELQYGLWAGGSLLAFIFPSLFVKAHQSFITIPAEVYRVWYYNTNSETPEEPGSIDYKALIVLEVELMKKMGDDHPVKIKAKAPRDLPFGVWFKRLINDYNIKSPLAPIEHFCKESEMGWMFYTRPSFFRSKRHIDFNKSFKENKIKERRTIIAKRVKMETTPNSAKK